MDNITSFDSLVSDTRTGVHSSNLQEIIDAGVNASSAVTKGQQQFQTPQQLAKICHGLLPSNRGESVIDPQCAAGHLLAPFKEHSRASIYGIEIDNRFTKQSAEDDSSLRSINRITGNCVKVIETIDELYPDKNSAAKWSCIVANPPFNLKWKQGNGKPPIDSTAWTWQFIETHLAPGGCGYVIANAATLERLGVTQHAWVYLYQRMPAGGLFEGVSGIDIGIVWFHRPPLNGFYKGSYTRKEIVWDTPPSPLELGRVATELELQYTSTYADPVKQWQTAHRVLREETASRPDFNIYLHKKTGMLRTYLSVRSGLKLDVDEVRKLARINDCHPLTLTTEKETRVLMHSLVTEGVFTVEPAAMSAINQALEEVASLACPLRPVTEFELVAYADEEDDLVCKALDQSGHIALTIGSRYAVSTGTYKFTEKYSRKKIHFNIDKEETSIEDHDCELSGADRYIQISDDTGQIQRFMERPNEGCDSWQHPEKMLWTLFKEPYVPTVKEVHADRYAASLRRMQANEMLSGFTYFPGQLEYYAAMSCKDYGIIAADVGTGKTLGALTMVATQCPERTLIIAPQGTMRSSGDESGTDYQASQWVEEIQRFAPGEPVFQMFSVQDWQAILRANGGELPHGIFITYPQAYFSNKAFEFIPKSWKERDMEEKFCKLHGLPFDDKRATQDMYHLGVGASSGSGIRCITAPSLATLITAHHGDAWDMAIIDEAHLCCNIDAFITRNLLRLQPKFRYAMTATPIPNIVTNLFSLMGWVCVPDWYKGERRNAAWPYAVDECHRFGETFLSVEQDKTAQEMARRSGVKGWRRSGTKESPIISSPARLLKLLKPSMAYISKEDCNPDLNPCEIIDVRVDIGKEQQVLYAYWLNRANYLAEYGAKGALVIAQVQSTRLRGICASPATVSYNRGLCRSDFNPKTVTILQIIRDNLARGEQTVVVGARTDQSDTIARFISDAGVPIARIDTNTPSHLKAAEAKRFKKGDARVMFMGIKCAQGYSFEQCPNLIISSLEWSYGTLHQAKGRVWRLNSPKPVKVWVILHKNTIEELLFDRVAVKQDSATLCLQGRRVPRDFKTLDASEVLAEHMVNYRAEDGGILLETECESQWPALRKQIIMASGGVVPPLADNVIQLPRPTMPDEEAGIAQLLGSVGLM